MPGFGFGGIGAASSGQSPFGGGFGGGPRSGIGRIPTAQWQPDSEAARILMGSGWAGGTPGQGGDRPGGGWAGAFLSPYTGAFGGTNYLQWLTNAMDPGGAFNQQWEAQRSQQQASGTPLDQLIGVEQFMRQMDPLAAYYNQRPGLRGEDPAAFSPFTVFRRR